MVGHIIQASLFSDMQLPAAQLYMSSKEMTQKKRRWLENQKVTGKKKIVILLTLEISRESYLSQLSCSHMELVQSLAPPRRNDRELPIPVVASRINTVVGPLPPQNQRVQELLTR